MQWIQSSHGTAMALEGVPAGYMLNMFREVRMSGPLAQPSSSSSSSADATARARPAAMCLAPLRPSFESENFFAPLSEDSEEFPELGTELAAKPKPERCAPRDDRGKAPRQPRRRRAKTETAEQVARAPAVETFAIESETAEQVARAPR